ncbi:MAG: hypothetical protein ACN4GZ_12225 [Acidimicrobiales bacterium]
MNEPIQDPDITEALDRLAPPPLHGPGFWDELNTGLSNQTANRASSPAHGTIRSLAVAAAALVVLVGGALVLSSTAGDGDQNIDVAAEATTTTTPAPTSTAPTTAAAVTTTTGPAQVTEPRPTLVGTPIDDSWVVLYSSSIAEGDYISRAQASIDCGMKDLAFARDGIIIHDYGERPGAFSYHPGPQGVLTRLSTCSGTFLEMSIGSELGAPASGFEPLALTPEPIVLEDLGWDLVDKVMVGTAIFTADPVSVRINSGTGEVTVVGSTQTCSSFGAAVPSAPAGLNADQRATFDAITAALAACDWDTLDELTPPTFMASFGGGDPIELWQSSEASDEPILAILLAHLSVQPGFDHGGFASWPRAAGEFWEDVTPEMQAELLDLGYTRDDFESYAEIGYIGYRTGIDADGTWMYYVAGD